ASWRALAETLSIAAAAALVLAVVSFSTAAALERPVPPLVRLATGVFGFSRTTRAKSVRAVLEAAPIDEPQVQSGMRLYGFGDGTTRDVADRERAPCSPPARALPGPGENGTDATELVR